MTTMILSSNDFYTTVINNEIITFKYQLSNITFEAKDKISIKINDSDIMETSFLIIVDEVINYIQVIAPSGTQVKWSGTTLGQL